MVKQSRPDWYGKMPAGAYRENVWIRTAISTLLSLAAGAVFLAIAYTILMSLGPVVI